MFTSTNGHTLVSFYTSMHSSSVILEMLAAFISINPTRITQGSPQKEENVALSVIFLVVLGNVLWSQI
jgi:hypothetical protein